ncbi:MAG: mechanosensitive ion channel protein MscS [Phycisphaeraceae bacterium]|nr:mechanosensitive ion channel protein MscS [Phycisphaeraceae bacterium]
MRIRNIAALWVLGMLVAGSARVAAQEAAPALDAGPYASPQDTMRTFLDAIAAAVDRNDDSSWGRVEDCLDISEINKDRARIAAEELRGVIDRLEFIDWRTTPLPTAALVAADGIRSYTYFPAPRFESKLAGRRVQGAIVLARGEDGRWRFSADTIARIRDLFRTVEEMDRVEQLQHVGEGSLSLWLRRQMPRALKGIDNELFTVEYWQWISLFVIILAGFLVDQVVRFVLRTIGLRLIARQGAGDRVESVRLAVRPIGLVAAAVVWLMLLRTLGLSDVSLFVLLGAARIFGILAGVWAAWRVTDLVSEVLLAKAVATDTKIDDVLIPLLRKTIKLFIIIFGFIFAADSLHMRDKVMPILASLGLGGVAFAFAAKDTVENLFGSIAVLLDRPFEVGDWVLIGDTEGTVEEVGFRSTRIRTFYNSQVTVPNSNLVRATVDNYGRRTYRRWKTYIGIQYDTPPDKMIAFVEGIRELIRTHPHTRKDYFHVYYNRFGPSSLDILLYVFHQVPDWGTELAERERLFVDIVRLADEIGVSFAFPTRTVHVAPGDGPALSEEAPRAFT